MEFQEFPKMARLSRECVVTEKIDGTNAQVYIFRSLDGPLPGHIAYKDEGTYGSLQMFAGSRTRWITPEQDNHGFAKWVKHNAEELFQLGEGRHFGEWWGQGIQRNYGMQEKRFSLFNAVRWVKREAYLTPEEDATVSLGPKQQFVPDCCHVVPVLYRGIFTTEAVEQALDLLRERGSFASPGFMRPEGVVAYHTAGGIGFKKTLENDELPKSMVK